MFGSIFFDPAGMGDTLATLDDTDLFGVRGEPLGTLGEASTGLPAAVGGCFAKRDWKTHKKSRLDIQSCTAVFKENVYKNCLTINHTKSASDVISYL